MDRERKLAEVGLNGAVELALSIGGVNLDQDVAKGSNPPFVAVPRRVRLAEEGIQYGSQN
jgi:hypothetical protein